jgi:hypothetical protein
MAIQDKYPSIKPSLNLDFANTKSLDPRIEFTRASSATYFDEFGVMRSASNNAPRIDHNPATGECLGLLVEEQRTNLLTYSEQFDNAAWAKTSVNLSSAANVAPNGIQAATLVVPTTDFGSHKVSSPSISFGASLPVCGSVYFKAGGYSRLRLRLGQSSGFLTDVVADASAGTVVEGNTANAAIIPIGNGWYRFSVFGKTGTSNTSVTYQLWVYDNSGSAGAPEFSGDGTSGVYIWGAQLEAGSFPTSYIKTEATAATRAADSAVMKGANFSSWYRQDEGTLFAEASVTGPNSADTTTTGIVTLGNSSTTDFMGITARTDNLSARFVVTPGSSLLTSGGAFPFNTFAKFAAAYKSLSFGFSHNGGILTNSANTVSASYPTELIIGAYYITTNRRLNGSIKRITYYPKRLINAKLQTLTQ